MPPRRYGWDEAGRLFWRLVVLGIVAAALFVGTGVLLKGVFPLGLPSGYQGQTVFFLMGAASVGLAHVAAAFLEKSGSWYVLGFTSTSWAARGLALSFVGGAAVMALSVGLLLALGMAQVQASGAGSIGAHLMESALIAAGWTLVDALLLRGYVFGAIHKRWGSWMAVAVTSLLAIGATLAVLRISVPAVISAASLALFLGAIRARTGGIAAPWLAHFAFVWTQVGLLNTQLAPLQLAMAPGYHVALGPPSILSGAGYGVDGGLISAVLLIGAAAWLMRDEPREIAPPRV